MKLILLLCLWIFAADSQTLRFKGKPGVIANNDAMLISFDATSEMDCLSRCGDKPNCEAYSFSTYNFQCRLGGPGYTVNENVMKSIVYEKTTTTAGTKSTSTHSGTSPASCPVIHKNWSEEEWSKGPGRWTVNHSPISTEIAPIQAVTDQDFSTKFISKKETFPYLIVGFNQPFRLTAIRIKTGSTRLAGVEVRIGDSNIFNWGGTRRITANQRCNAFMGPTGVDGEVIYLGCSSPRGLLGKYLSIQLTERNETTSPLEIVELGIMGFMRECVSQDLF